MDGTDINISVIICTKDRHEEIRRFFASLDSQSLLPGEVVVVDASATEETARFIESQKAEGKEYALHYEHMEPGMTRQRNRGLDLSRGGTVIYFDDDVVLEKGCVKAMGESFRDLSHTRLGGVTGRITNVSEERKGGLDRALKKAFFLSDLGSGRVKASGFPEHRVGDEPGFVQVVSGCCMAFRRHVLESLRFDERLSGYCYMEDVDISRRLTAAGYLIYYQPGARLAHLSPTHAKGADTRSLRSMYIRNHRYFFRKNGKKDLAHAAAFAWSIAGVFWYNLLLSRDIRAARGVLEGLRGSVDGRD